MLLPEWSLQKPGKIMSFPPSKALRASLCLWAKLCRLPSVLAPFSSQPASLSGRALLTPRPLNTASCCTRPLWGLHLNSPLQPLCHPLLISALACLSNPSCLQNSRHLVGPWVCVVWVNQGGSSTGYSAAPRPGRPRAGEQASRAPARDPLLGWTVAFWPQLELWGGQDHVALFSVIAPGPLTYLLFLILIFR